MLRYLVLNDTLAEFEVERDNYADILTRRPVMRLTIAMCMCVCIRMYVHVRISKYVITAHSVVTTITCVVHVELVHIRI